MSVKKYLLILVVLAALLSWPVSALASDISDADYYGTIVITNNGTANTTGVSCNVSPGDLSTRLIAGDFCDSAFTRAAIRDSTGNDVPFMPGYGSDPWMIWVDTIRENATQNDIFFTGNGSMDSTKSIFGTLSTADAASLEMGDNFTYEINCYLDMSQSGNISYSSGRYDLYHDTDNVTFQAIGTSANLSATVASGNKTIEINYGTHDYITQTIYDAYTDYQNTEWWAETFTTTTQKVISGVIIRSKDLNGLVGTVTARLRATSGGKPTGADLVTGTTTSINQAANWYYIPFTTHYTVNAATKYAIIISVGATDWICWYADSTSPIYSGGEPCISTDSGATWDTLYNLYALTWDMAFKIVYEEVQLNIDGVLKDSQIIDITIPNNASSYIDGSSTVPYINHVKRHVNGVLVQDIAWEYAATFTDLSGNSNDATPTLRTTTSDSDVTANLTMFQPYDPSIAPEFSVTQADQFYLDSITTSGTFSSTGLPSDDVVGYTGPPGTDVINDAADAGGTPRIWLWGILAGIAIIFFGLFMTWMERTYGGGGGTLLIRIAGITVIFGLMVAFKIFDFWMVFIFLIFAAGIGIMSRHIEFGGTVSQLNLIGFLAQCWIGLTLINRIIEGNLITSYETGWANYYAFTQEFKMFDLFSLPVINFDYFTKGLPALMKWDYAVFGGNAQIIQYMLYSITAVVSMIIFVTIVGLLYSAFNRLR